MRAAFPGVPAAVGELLGATLVAYLGSVKHTRAVAQWAAGERAPGSATQAGLWLALQIGLMIAGADEPGVAQAWFQGVNALLDDDSPARLLRDGEPATVGPQVVGAARSCLNG